MAAMGTMDLNVIQQNCRFLRSKGMFIDSEPDPSVPGSGEPVYWCIHTMNCLGPDGQVATRESCQPGRGCYREY
jgi:hypothetical protein